MNYEINAIIFDKTNPADWQSEPVNLQIITVIIADSQEFAINKLYESYNVIEIISVVEI